MPGLFEMGRKSWRLGINKNASQRGRTQVKPLSARLFVFDFSKFSQL